MLILAGPVGDLQHDGGDHPEHQGRVTAAMAGVEDLHLGSDLVTVQPLDPTEADLARVHDRELLDQLESTAGGPPAMFDPDTYVGADSWEAARRAAGAGLAAVRELERRRSGVGLVLARPPGHHATARRAMGFCLINSVAVAAAWLVARGERVLIVDWDVHHGNGTQDIFWDEPAVLYVSTHQWPLYPGTGRADEVGGAAARGLTVNVPLPPGATGDVVRRALGDVAAPVVSGFAPTWVLVSAGFDAHRLDPLGGLGLSAGDFAQLAGDVAALSPAPGRLALFLEGGYDPGALRRSVSATVARLVGGPTLSPRQATDERPTSGGPGTDAVRDAAETYRVATARD